MEVDVVKMNVRYFIGERPSSELVAMCDRVGVNVGIMNESTIEEIIQLWRSEQEIGRYDQLRYIHNELRDRRFIKSHLSVLFHISTGQLSKVLCDDNRGISHGGRPKILGDEEEERVVEFIRSCQRSGHCVTFGEVTTYINEDLLLDDQLQRKVSGTFVRHNEEIMQHFEVATPQPVEQLRIDACKYDNFRIFFSRLSAIMHNYNYDTDLIINTDETTSNADKTKRVTKVIYDANINIRPTATYGSKTEHITLCCSISASGKSLLPVFIIKNQNVTAEDSLTGMRFDYGDYGITSSPNGWQDNVCMHVILL